MGYSTFREVKKLILDKTGLESNSAINLSLNRLLLIEKILLASSSGQPHRFLLPIIQGRTKSFLRCRTKY